MWLGCGAEVVSVLYSVVGGLVIWGEGEVVSVLYSVVCGWVVGGGCISTVQCSWGLGYMGGGGGCISTIQCS